MHQQAPGRYIAETTAGEENIRAVHFHSLAYDLARQANEIEERDEQPLPDDPPTSARSCLLP